MFETLKKCYLLTRYLVNGEGWTHSMATGAVSTKKQVTTASQTATEEAL